MLASTFYAIELLTGYTTPFYNYTPTQQTPQIISKLNQAGSQGKRAIYFALVKEWKITEKTVDCGQNLTIPCPYREYNDNLRD
jgi:hypothetical protein